MILRLPFQRCIKKTIIDYLENERLNDELKKNNWFFSGFRKAMIKNETNDWLKHYLPIDVKGLTVLDIGAGEGETAKLYLDHKTEKVICIEPDKECFDYLCKNSEYHNIIPANTVMQPHHFLHTNCDLIKIDIEGYEEILLNYNLPDIPIIVEIHGLQQIEKFKKKGFRVIEPQNKVNCVTYGYWRC